ncbi:hypothetical protein GJAV_G00120880 [Gymnothorax javanicus]|nr:hypothetical protein GJAV_G00120880 [Gymnothorax javanicus]
MKTQSSSPVHVHVEDSTPVYVHVQRSRSLPSFAEADRRVPCGASTDPGDRAHRKRKEKKVVQKSHSSERVLPKSSVTPGQAGQIWEVMRSSDADDDPAGPGAQTPVFSSSRSAERERSVSFEEESSDAPAGTRMCAEELEQSSGRQEGEDWGRVQAEGARERSSHEERAPDHGPLLLTALLDAEKAANAASIQLMSFTEGLVDQPAESRLNASEERRMSRQKSLLLEKLEVFRTMNRAVRQQLKDFQEREVDRLEADRRMYVLLKKLAGTETENLNLKRDFVEKQGRIEDLIDLRQQEKEKLEMVQHQAKSVETTRAHLQRQLRHKESENNRLSVQLRGLEKSSAEQKLQIEGLKAQVSSAAEREREEKDALKKGIRVQKQRAERFETAMEKSYDRLREKEAELASVRSEVEAWRRRQEPAREGTAPLEAQISALKQQISDMNEQLDSERENFRTTNAELLQKVENLNCEDAELRLENAALKASVSDLQEKLGRCADEQAAGLQQQERVCDEFQSQVVEQQREVTALRARVEEVMKENAELREGGERELGAVREVLQVRVSELEIFPELLREAEQRLRDCETRLRDSEQDASLKTLALQQLRTQMESQTEQLTSSRGLKDSINQTNAELQGKIDLLERRVQEMTAENGELVQKLTAQEEALGYSGKQLERRSAECLSLSRQLETALADVTQQVTIVKEKAAARERTLQGKILELDSDRNRREQELKALRSSKESMEKMFEMRQKDLQLRLDQSENQKRSIQNYIDFLKNSYTTMFEDSLSADLGFSSLK